MTTARRCNFVRNVGLRERALSHARRCFCRESASECGIRLASIELDPERPCVSFEMCRGVGRYKLSRIGAV